MSAHIDALLAQYALGILPDDQHAEVQRHLETDPAARQTLGDLRTAATQLGAVTPQVDPAPASSRERLGALGRGVHRFMPFLDRVAHLFDVSADDAQTALERIDDPSTWTRLRTGVRYVDVDGGPRIHPRHAGLVRMDPGVVFPHHSHQGDESFIILQGTAHDSEGTRMQPGDLITNEDGSAHSVHVGDQELIYAIVLGGYTFTSDAAP